MIEGIFGRYNAYILIDHLFPWNLTRIAVMKVPYEIYLSSLEFVKQYAVSIPVETTLSGFQFM